jgi:hypothetical protein
MLYAPPEVINEVLPEVAEVAIARNETAEVPLPTSA